MVISTEKRSVVSASIGVIIVGEVVQVAHIIKVIKIINLCNFCLSQFSTFFLVLQKLELALLVGVLPDPVIVADAAAEQE